MNQKQITVFYHAECLDGFGANYAAWKKFGDDAVYIPIQYGHEPDAADYTGKEVYFVDFCYPQEIMDRVQAAAKLLVVLDHHEGVRGVATLYQGVFDPSRSGATIAWTYFHPDTPIPSLLLHVEDEDLYTFKLPDTRAIGVYLSAQPYEINLWDGFVKALEDPAQRAAFVAKAETYLEYFNHLVEIAVEHAHPIHFEGYTVLLANSVPVRTIKSAIGNAITKKMPPFGLVASVHPNGIGISIRGDGSVDVSAIARKYGGNGHPSSSGFRIPWQLPMPFTSAEEDENPGN
jgi:oligoribonuclease NrnB/cAMP/cGMP phosphodiesterase (DHH superfamily)